MTRKDEITNARIRGRVKKKTQEAKFRWYEHIMRSNRESDEKRTLGMEVQVRRRGRPKTRWKD